MRKRTRVQGEQSHQHERSHASSLLFSITHRPPAFCLQKVKKYEAQASAHVSLACALVPSSAHQRMMASGRELQRHGQASSPLRDRQDSVWTAARLPNPESSDVEWEATQVQDLEQSSERSDTVAEESQVFEKHTSAADVLEEDLERSWSEDQSPPTESQFPPATESGSSCTDFGSSIHKKRRDNAQLLERKGLLALARAVLVDNVDTEDAEILKGADAEDICLSAYQILMTTDPDVLRSLVAGELADEIARNRDMRRLLQKMKSRTANDESPQPAIYANILVDSSMKSPTPAKLLEVMDILEGYYNGTDDNRALEIDSLYAPRPIQADRMQRYTKRKYLLNSQKRASTSRLENLEAFVDALRKRLSAVPAAEHNKPMRSPLIEIGYTHQSGRRPKDHLDHTALPIAP